MYRLLRRLDFASLPSLFRELLPSAKANVRSSPGTYELALDTDRQRLSGGDWDAPFSQADLCSR